MEKRDLRISLSVCFMLLLSACGFHLRGYSSHAFTNSPIFLLNQTHDTDLWRVLYTQLSRQGLKILENPKSTEKVIPASSVTPAKAGIPSFNQLILISSNMQQTLISVSSNTQIRQYRLSYQIIISFQPINTAKTFSQPFFAERVITINSQQRLGSDDAISSSIQAMRQQLASAVMEYLSTNLGNNSGAHYPDVMGGIKKKF